MNESLIVQIVPYSNDNRSNRWNDLNDRTDRSNNERIAHRSTMNDSFMSLNDRSSRQRCERSFRSIVQIVRAIERSFVQIVQIARAMNDERFVHRSSFLNDWND